MKNPNNITLQKFVIPIAILAGVIRVIIDFIPRILEPGPIIYYLTFPLCFIAEIFLILFAIRKYRTLKKTLELKEALQIGMIIMLFIGILYSACAYTYDTYIDPNFQMRNTIEFVETVNPAQVDAVKAQLLESQNNPSPLGIFIAIIWFVFIGFIISLIVGNMMKKSESDY